MSEWQLILETSGRVGKVGLAKGREVVHSAKLDETRRHARDLSATIQSLLIRESLTVADMKAILVSIGPGGYTGLRVALTTAKTLSYAAGVPLVAVPTFHAIAAQAPPEAVPLWVIGDALQGTIYLQRFERAVPFDELRIVVADEWLAWANAEVWLSGPGVDVYADRLPCGIRTPNASQREATIEGVLRAAEKLTPLGREEFFAIEPLYLRGSSAEEKARQTQARTGP